jgi:hypothetical protein
MSAFGGKADISVPVALRCILKKTARLNTRAPADSRPLTAKKAKVFNEGRFRRVQIDVLARHPHVTEAHWKRAEMYWLTPHRFRRSYRPSSPCRLRG